MHRGIYVYTYSTCCNEDSIWILQCACTYCTHRLTHHLSYSLEMHKTLCIRKPFRLIAWKSLSPFHFMPTIIRQFRNLQLITISSWQYPEHHYSPEPKELHFGMWLSGYFPYHAMNNSLDPTINYWIFIISLNNAYTQIYMTVLQIWPCYGMHLYKQ